MQIESNVLSSKQKDEKRASIIMNTLDIYAETLAKALKYIEEKNKFEAENIGNIDLHTPFTLIIMYINHFKDKGFDKTKENKTSFWQSAL